MSSPCYCSDSSGVLALLIKLFKFSLVTNLAAASVSSSLSASVTICWLSQSGHKHLLVHSIEAGEFCGYLDICVIFLGRV